LDHLPERPADVTALLAVLDDRRRRSQEFFDRHARQWDDLTRSLLPVPDYLDRLVALVPLGGTVLEVGLGTGGLLPDLAARGSRVIGVDHAPAMLDEARRRLAQAGLTCIDLRLGEMTHLPLPDNEVGCAVANMVLHHAADPTAVLHEFRRVLAPGGVLVLADLARHEREWVREQLADQWLGFEEAELLAWLKEAGFIDVSSERLKSGAGEVAVLLVRAS
jgi:ArsR family transcriptional regulator